MSITRAPRWEWVRTFDVLTRGADSLEEVGRRRPLDTHAVGVVAATLKEADAVARSLEYKAASGSLASWQRSGGPQAYEQLKAASSALRREARALVRDRSDAERRVALLFQVAEAELVSPGMGILETGVPGDFGVDATVAERWVTTLVDAGAVSVGDYDPTAGRTMRVTPKGLEQLEQTLLGGGTTLLSGARDRLRSAGWSTAAEEIDQAVADLSRRPHPDRTGAVQHALAALECVTRSVCGDSGRTLGDLLNRHKDLFPPPMNAAVEKLWGFASERARHVREGHEPDHAEVTLVVHVSAAAAAYLAAKAELVQRAEGDAKTTPDFGVDF